MSITQNTDGAGGFDLIQRARLAAAAENTMYGGSAGELYNALADALASAPPAEQGNGAITEWLAEQEAAARGRANDQRPASSSEHWHRAQAAAYEAAHAYAIAQLLATVSSAASTAEREGFTCAARRQGSAGGNDPADCNWPVCGCDPHADKVIAALQESGLLASAPPAPTPEAGRLAYLNAEEARDLANSERISVAQAIYADWMEDYDPTAPDHEVHLFDAMKAAILAADLYRPASPPPAEDLAGQGEPLAVWIRRAIMANLKGEADGVDEAVAVIVSNLEALAPDLVIQGEPVA